MKADAKSRIAEQIEVVVSKLKDLPQGATTPEPDAEHFLNLPGKVKCLDSSSAGSYHELLQSFRKHEPFKTKVSRRLLAHLIENLLAEYLSDERDRERLIALINKVESTAIAKVKMRDCYIAIAGVTLNNLEIAFGDHKMFQMDQPRYDQLVNDALDIVERRPSNDTHKEAYKKIVREYFEPPNELCNRACIVVRLEGDEEVVREEALSEAASIVHILAFAAHDPLQTSRTHRIGLFATSAADPRRRVPIFDTDRQTLSLTRFRAFDARSLKIDETILFDLKGRGLQELIDTFCLKDGNAKDIDKKLLRAVEYFYNGYSAIDPASEFVQYIMILECVLSPDDREQLSKSIAEGVALLLESDRERRRALYDLVRRLYKKRNAIVHGGISRPNSIDVIYARRIAWDLVRHVVKNKNSWKKKNAIMEHLDQIRFG
jgi:hypothetical protein